MKDDVNCDKTGNKLDISNPAAAPVGIHIKAAGRLTRPQSRCADQATLDPPPLSPDKGAGLVLTCLISTGLVTGIALLIGILA